MDQRQRKRKAYNFVPSFFFRPNPANQLAPRRQIVGATATVSTLATVLGQPNRPTSAGKGGFNRGFPCFPSILSIRAVSSYRLRLLDVRTRQRSNLSHKHPFPKSHEHKPH